MYRNLDLKDTKKAGPEFFKVQVESERSFVKVDGARNFNLRSANVDGFENKKWTVLGVLVDELK